MADSIIVKPSGPDACYQTTRSLRVLFALPGLHLIQRGAEVALEKIADELARLPDLEVTAIGAGKQIEGRHYRFQHVGCVGRRRFERFPQPPLFRSETHYEEFTFAMNLLTRYRPSDYDITVTCGYPWLNWLLRGRTKRGKRPLHFYVTQNGDWPARDDRSEFRYFGCDGIVCINPDHFEANCERWTARLIPNGVDVTRFRPGPVDRSRFDLPADAPVALMVSALIPSKRVLEGVRAASRVNGLHLMVAGDGPLREELRRLGQELMPERLHNMVIPHDEIPDLYRASDVYLQMSQDESFGIVYLEALATGLPIVAHDRPVTRWIVEDQATLIDTSDIDAVATALLNAPGGRSGIDIEARRDLVQRRYAWSQIARAYADFFRELMDPSGE